MFITSAIFALVTVAALAAAQLVAQAAPVQEPEPSGSNRWSNAERRGTTRKRVRLLALIPAVLTLVFAIFASVYAQAPGEAKVLINIGGTVAGVDTTPGISVKAPWQSILSVPV